MNEIKAQKRLLSDKQRRYLRESYARINMQHGAIRSGKTFSCILRWIKFIGTEAPRGDLIMTGKTLGSLKRNIVNPMQDLIGADFNYHGGGSEFTAHIYLWGRRIYCFGADTETSEGKIRGMTVAGALQDEVTLSPISYFKTTLGRMSVDGARYFGTTNADSPYHPLKVEYLNRAKALGIYETFWELNDNPSLSEKYKESISREYVGLWHKRFIKGLWVLAEGAIYDFFEEEKHTVSIGEINANFRAREFVVVVDYGTSGVTVFLLIAINRGKESKWKAVAVKEFIWDAVEKGKQKTDGEFSQDMKEWLGPIRPSSIIVDPSCNSLQVQLRKDGFENVIDADNSIIDGIRKQSTMLKNGEYVLCREGCRRTIQDYSGYIWDKKKQLSGEDVPEAGPAEHTKDTERYGLYTMFGPNASFDLDSLSEY